MTKRSSASQQQSLSITTHSETTPSETTHSNQSAAISNTSEPSALPASHSSNQGSNGADSVEVDLASDAAQKETSLRSRLLKTVLPVVLVPLAIAGLVGFRLVQQRTEVRTQQQLTNQVLLASESTVAVLDEFLSLPEIIAASPLVINEALAGYKQAIAAGYDDRSADELEREFEASKLLRSHRRLNQYLRETAENAGISEILVTESNGLNIAYSQPVTDFVQRDEEWWQKGKETQRWISPPDFDYAAKGFTITLAQAITDPATGEFAGVIRAVFPTRKFSLLAQHLKRTGIIGSQRVQIVDGASLKVIDTFSPQGFLNVRSVIGEEPIEQFIEAFVAETTNQTQPMLTVSDRLSTSSKSSIRKLAIEFSDEVTTAMSFVQGGRQFKIANIPNTEWVAITSMEAGEISAAARDAFWFLALTILLLGAITTALIFRLAKQLSVPLSTLAMQADSVASGDFSLFNVPTQKQGGTRETQTLTRRFNELTTRIQTLLQRQERETHKARLFAAITGAKVNNLVDLHPLLADVLPEAREILKSDRLLFCSINNQNIEPLIAESTASSISSALTHAHPTQGLEGKSLDVKPGSPAVAINNVTNVHYTAQSQTYFDELDIWATLSVPVFQEETLFGFFIAHRNTVTEWSPAETQFITQLAAQLKLVLDRVAALQSVRSSRQSAQASKREAEVLSAENRQQSLSYSRQQAQLQQQLSALIENIQGVSTGDLTIRAQATSGELETVADIFNLTMDRLQALVTQVKQSTLQVKTLLTKEEAIGAQLAQATQSQTLEAQKVLENVQSLSRSVSAIAADAQKAAATANLIATTVESGETGMTLTATRISQLNDVSTIAVKQIEGLGRSGNHIGQVTEIIRELADEVSTLSQQVRKEFSDSANGSDENFEVAALTQKIDRLALRTLEETTLIDSFLKSLEQRAQQVAASIEEISKQVSQSTQLVENSKQSFEEVAVVAKQFDQLASAITHSTQSQSQASQVVANLVQEVVELSEQAAAFSQEMETSLSTTLQTAQTLEDSITPFKA